MLLHTDLLRRLFLIAFSFSFVKSVAESNSCWSVSKLLLQPITNALFTYQSLGIVKLFTRSNNEFCLPQPLRKVVIETPEKTVGTWLLRSGVYYKQSFLCRKNFVGYSPFFYKKRLAFFYGVKLIFRSFATFFGKTISWSGAKQRFCFTGCRSVWDQTARTWAPGFLAWGQLTSHALNYNLPYNKLHWHLFSIYLKTQFYVYLSTNFEIIGCNSCLKASFTLYFGTYQTKASTSKDLPLYFLAFRRYYIDTAIQINKCIIQICKENNRT